MLKKLPIYICQKKKVTIYIYGPFYLHKKRMEKKRMQGNHTRRRDHSIISQIIPHTSPFLEQYLFFF
jgi:hypothetical protein